MNFYVQQNSYGILSLFLKILGILVPLLIGVAFLTLAERKVMASMQRRKGPNVVGFFGILQPVADGLKLLLKEPVLPSNANFILFLLAPVFLIPLPPGFAYSFFHSPPYFWQLLLSFLAHPPFSFFLLLLFSSVLLLLFFFFLLLLILLLLLFFFFLLLFLLQWLFVFF